MKKTITILLSLFMILGLAACGKSADQTEQSSTERNAVESTINDIPPAENRDTDAVESTDIPEKQPEGETEIPNVQEKKILVAYFSATNTTKGVAENLADGIGADLYEIVPETPYTDADLNYKDNNSRTTIEMNDPDARPVISSSVENMEQYDVIFLGYPIWWGDAPMAVYSFLESYDLSGKTIIPFCTSGGTGISGSVKNIRKACKGAKVKTGLTANNVSDKRIRKWLKKNKVIK